MALSRRGAGRFPASIWPGFVDAMTALILVLFFVLSIFMIVQFVLRDTITGQDRELDELSVQVANLADALGLERSRADRAAELVSTLTQERDAATAEIAEFESQVASLIARNTDLDTRLAASETSLAEAQAEGARQIDANEALELALSRARDEVDAGAEAARLAAARREALEALVASLQSDVADLQGNLNERDTSLSEAETARLAEAAAAEELRRRLADSDAELTAMTLNLEAERKKAQDTLTLLAAAEAARDALQGDRTEALTEAEKRAAELAQARALLSQEQEISAESQRQVALLNQQTAELRNQLDQLQGLLDLAEAGDVASKVQIEKLGANLNAALARVAAEERSRAEAEAARAEAEAARAEAESARAEMEARERARIEEESKDLASYRSEFFGRMRAILGDREGVRVVGDRFVFDSEVLFPPGSATLGTNGRAQVARVAQVIRDIAGDIPPEVDWILRVDGHTDNVPVSPGGAFRDNWELSQARALSVVQYMIDNQGFPADRLAATGFADFQPVDTGSSPEALARNRRIELKFTER